MVQVINHRRPEKGEDHTIQIECMHDTPPTTKQKDSTPATMQVSATTTSTMTVQKPGQGRERDIVCVIVCAGTEVILDPTGC